MNCKTAWLDIMKQTSRECKRPAWLDLFPRIWVISVATTAVAQAAMYPVTTCDCYIFVYGMNCLC